jgi:hypothetical protein
MNTEDLISDPMFDISFQQCKLQSERERVAELQWESSTSWDDKVGRDVQFS